MSIRKKLEAANIFTALALRFANSPKPKKVAITVARKTLAHKPVTQAKSQITIKPAIVPTIVLTLLFFMNKVCYANKVMIRKINRQTSIIKD